MFIDMRFNDVTQIGEGLRSTDSISNGIGFEGGADKHYVPDYYPGRNEGDHCILTLEQFDLHGVTKGLLSCELTNHGKYGHLGEFVKIKNYKWQCDTWD